MKPKSGSDDMAEDVVGGPQPLVGEGSGKEPLFTRKEFRHEQA